MIGVGQALDSVLSGLWSAAGLEQLEGLSALLPRDEESLTRFYPRLRDYVVTVPRRLDGTIDPAATIRGDIISMGEGSVIEPGAIIHESCRLILGPRSRVRSGAVLRDEVIVGSECMIGVHCEVVRSVILGPASYLGHFVFLADSIVGRDVNVSGYVAVANTNLRKGGEISIRSTDSKIPTGRTHLGALIGDGVRLG